MPTAADKIDNEETLLRIVVYGPARSRKTWWTLKFAELGFNVHLLDADKGWEIVHQIKPEARKLINVIDCADTDKPIACWFLVNLMRRRKMLWDEQAKEIPTVNANINQAHAHYALNFNKLTRNDVLIIDSWSAIVASLFMRYFQEQNVDLYEVDENERNKRAEFGWTGTLANFFLDQITSLPCHVILVGHETVWEKRGTKTVNGRKQEVIEFTRTQLASTSGPNARDIIRRFGNALHFGLTLTGDTTINTQCDPEEDAGSRIVPPKKYSWAELQPAKLCELGRVYIPDGTQQSEAVQWFGPNSDLTLEKAGLTAALAPTVIKGNQSVPTEVNVPKPVVKPNPFAQAAAGKK